MVTRAFVFTSRDDDFISTAIAWVSRRKEFRLRDTPSHCGIAFADDEGNVTYYEAHYRSGGWSGPWAWDKLASWVGRGNERWVRLYALDLNADQLDRLFSLANKYRSIWPYSLRQLVHMYRWLRTGLPITTTDDAVVCSEAVSRLLYAVAPRDHIPSLSGRVSHEYVAPVDVQMVCETVWEIAPEVIR